jgi:FkbM family methyltransferase
LLLSIRHIVVRTHQIAKHYMRQIRRLVRRHLVRRVKPAARRFRRSVELIRLLGFTQTMRFLILWLRGARTAVLTVPGVRTPLLCRTFGSDRWVVRGVFGEQQYDIALQDPPELIIDAGANVGYASVYFANKYPNAHIIAIEPDPENCALFHRNCAAYRNVELIQGALWTSRTDLIIENCADESWAFRVVETPASTNNSFKGFTVADILRHSGKQHIDLLKLDIEGSEEQLFSSDYESWIGHVKNMMIELHGQRCRDVVLAATQESGFSVSQSGAHIFLKTEALEDHIKMNSGTKRS